MKAYTIDYIIDNKINETEYGFIYITKCSVNNKMYIGKRKFYGKWKDYLGSGTMFKKALKQYGIECFSKTIIDFAKTSDELGKLEIYYINKYDAANPESDYYNISDGHNSYAGKSLEELYEVIKKQKDIWARKTEEEIKQISESRIGCKNPFFGKHHTAESRFKISKNNACISGSEHKLSKSVILINTGEIFENMVQAGKKYNTDASHIGHCCNGKRKSAGKHPETGEKLVWEYKN